MAQQETPSRTLYARPWVTSMNKRRENIFSDSTSVGTSLIAQRGAVTHNLAEQVAVFVLLSVVEEVCFHHEGGLFALQPPSKIKKADQPRLHKRPETAPYDMCLPGSICREEEAAVAALNTAVWCVE